MLHKILDKYREEEFIKADGFDEAVIGVVDDKLVYSISKCIDVLKQDMSEEEALEYFDYNVRGSYIGEKTPLWCDDYFEA